MQLRQIFCGRITAGAITKESTIYGIDKQNNGGFRGCFITRIIAFTLSKTDGFYCNCML